MAQNPRGKSGDASFPFCACGIRPVARALIPLFERSLRRLSGLVLFELLAEHLKRYWVCSQEVKGLFVIAF